MTLDQFLGIECFSLKRYTRKNILSKVVLSHISSYESTCPNFENESESHSVMSDSLWPHVLYSPWNSPGQNTGVDSLSLLQGIFPTQESNPSLPHCRQILYQLSHRGSKRGKGKEILNKSQYLLRSFILTPIGGTVVVLGTLTRTISGCLYQLAIKNSHVETLLH